MSHTRKRGSIDYSQSELLSGRGDYYITMNHIKDSELVYILLASKFLCVMAIWQTPRPSHQET